MDSIQMTLKRHKFLEGMDSKLIEKIALSAAIAYFPPCEYIFRQGQKADHFFLIQRGKVEVELFSGTGGPIVVQTLEAGDVLGWSWLTPPYQWRFDARAVTPVEMIVLNAEDLHGQFSVDHELGFELLKRFIAVVTQRLEAERLQLVSLYGAHT